MLFYVEIHEARRSVVTLRAGSAEEAKERALQLAAAGELDVDTLDREAIAVRHPAEDQQAA